MADESFDDLIRAAARKSADSKNYERFVRGYRKPLEGEELEREADRLFREFLVSQANKRARERYEKRLRESK